MRQGPITGSATGVLTNDRIGALMAVPAPSSGRIM